ncbi:MAG: hydrogenase maturation protease [Bacteroidetes bacterium]|nr:hydrogenase maturation protease [Bacteroidota bacterium]
MMSENCDKKLLVLGMGSEILMDDGVGSRLANKLREENLPPGFHVETSNIGGLELLEIIKDYDQLIILDGMRGGSDVGDLHFFSPENFRETLHLSTKHDASFLNALKVGEHVGYNLPRSINIVGIEVEEDRCFGEYFSDNLEERIKNIYNEIKKLVFAEKNS